jgi:hypothetical protein
MGQAARLCILAWKNNQALQLDVETRTNSPAQSWLTDARCKQQCSRDNAGREQSSSRQEARAAWRAGCADTSILLWSCLPASNRYRTVQQRKKTRRDPVISLIWRARTPSFRATHATHETPLVAKYFNTGASSCSSHRMAMQRNAWGRGAMRFADLFFCLG